MTMLKRGHGWLEEERGQAGIFMAAALFIMVVPLFAAVFDMGLLLNDRRTAQSSADKAALAGAQDLTLVPGADGWDTARTAARQWLIRNGVDPDTQATVEKAYASDCYSGLPSTVLSYYGNSTVGVTVTIDRDTPEFVANALNVDMRAHASATACAGTPIEHHGIFPMVVSKQGLLGTCFDASGNAIPGGDCKIRVENSSGLVGALSVAYDPDNPVDCTDAGSGANDLENNLEFGINAWCTVGEQVWAKTGETLNKTFDGVKARLSHEGACDEAYAGTTAQLTTAWSALDDYLRAYPGYAYTPLKTSDNRGALPRAGDGIDDFYEVWEYPGASAPASGLSERNCPGYDGDSNSPRNIVIIVVPDTLNTSDSNGHKYTILQFARMYLEGCTRTTVNGRRTTEEFRRDCSWNSLGSGRLTLHARYVEQVGSSGGQLGLTSSVTGDREIFLKQ